MKMRKSLWVYLSVLLFTAIALIILTTIMQYKVIDDDGKFDISSSFTQNAKQNIQSLTEKNIELGASLDEANSQNAALKEELDASRSELEKITQERDNAAKLYAAYKDGDKDKMREIMQNTDRGVLEIYIPGLYDYVTNALN